MYRLKSVYYCKIVCTFSIKTVLSTIANKSKEILHVRLAKNQSIKMISKIVIKVFVQITNAIRLTCVTKLVHFNVTNVISKDALHVKCRLNIILDIINVLQVMEQLKSLTQKNARIAINGLKKCLIIQLARASSVPQSFDQTIAKSYVSRLFIFLRSYFMF